MLNINKMQRNLLFFLNVMERIGKFDRNFQESLILRSLIQLISLPQKKKKNIF